MRMEDSSTTRQAALIGWLEVPPDVSQQAHSGTVDLLLTGATVVTLDPERRVLRDGAIAVAGQSIVAVGSTAELAHLPARRVIDARHKVVTPGFVDAHLHLTEGARGFVPDDVAPNRWVMDWVTPIMASLTPDEELLLSRLVLTEALKTGTTTVVEGGTVVDIPSAVQAVEETGIRANLGAGWIWDVPPEPERFRRTTDGCLRTLEDGLSRWTGAAQGRVQVWMHLVGNGTQSDDLIRGAKALADRHGVGVSQHQSKLPEEVERFTAAHGVSPIEHLADLGVLGPNLRLVHALVLSDAEVRLLRGADVKLVHSLLCALNQGYGALHHGRFHELIRDGLDVSLGCDGANCSNSFDMVRSMYALATVYGDRWCDRSLITAERAIEVATLGGARSVLMEGEIGSLEPGKKADIVVFDANRPEWLPLLNVAQNLVYSADGRSVEMVIVDGSVVVESGRLTGLDEDELYDQVRSVDWVSLFNERTGLALETRWPYS